MIEDNQILSCGAPETIEYLTCGANSTLLPDGSCRVVFNQTFSIDYKVNDVESCYGTEGNAAWQGSLQPFTGGSGTFSKSIPGGINQQTTFQLNCIPNPSVHHFTNVAKHSVIDLRNMFSNAASMSTANQLLAYDLDQEKHIFLDHDYSHFKNHVGEPLSLMIRQMGTNLYFVPTIDRREVMVPKPEYAFDENFSLFLTIVQNLPEDRSVSIPIDQNQPCHSLSTSNTGASINIDAKRLGDACELDWSKPQYLLWYVLENAPQMNIRKSDN